MSKKDIYIRKIKEVIENTNKKLTLKEIVEITSIPKTSAHRIIKELNYECAKSDPWNKGLTKETNKILQNVSNKLQSRTGWKHSAETRNKISNSMKGKGGIREGAGRGESYYYGDDLVNSDYELKIARLLDEEGISWENKNSIIQYNDNGITRMMSLGFYLPDYDIYMVVKYHINSDTRRRIRLAEKQNDIKVIVVDEMMFRRITYNSIRDILKNSLQN